jgi:hypothetical protein
MWLLAGALLLRRNADLKFRAMLLLSPASASSVAMRKTPPHNFPCATFDHTHQKNSTDRRSGLDLGHVRLPNLIGCATSTRRPRRALCWLRGSGNFAKPTRLSRLQRPMAILCQAFLCTLGGFLRNNHDPQQPPRKRPTEQRPNHRNRRITPVRSPFSSHR